MPGPGSRKALIDAICEIFSEAQLSAMLRQTFRNNQGLDYYARPDTLPLRVDELLATLEHQGRDLYVFLLSLRRDWAHDYWPLVVAIDNLIDTPQGPNPYDDLVVLQEPFVDRATLRNLLQQLFQGPGARRALVTTGAPASGKSHSRWLIQHVASRLGIQAVVVDLVDTSVDDVVGQLINELGLPVEFRDRLEQQSRIGKAFASALRGHLNRRDVLRPRWCLVFDGHNHATVPAPTREFVDMLLAETVKGLDIYLVLLGYQGTLPAALSPKVHEETVRQVQPADVERFLETLAASVGGGAPQAGFGQQRAAIVFAGLAAPYDHDAMATIKGRLYQEVVRLQQPPAPPAGPGGGG